MAAPEGPAPRSRKVADIKAKLLQPALTSHYEIYIAEPIDGKWRAYKSANGLANIDKDKLHLLCSETILPGSSFATHEINNDFTGVTERHAYRRLFDDRIDLTFYVDANEYLPIRFFEVWMKYIANESISGNTGGGTVGVSDPTYSYGFRYPEQYYGGLVVTKFERDHEPTGARGFAPGSRLAYKFVNVYPIALTSIPVSYESSSLLKCTVSCTYIRYFIEQASSGKAEDLPANPAPATSQNQAYFGNNAQAQAFQNAQFGVGGVSAPGLQGEGLLNTVNTGGVPTQAANAAGNTVERKVEAGLPYVGRNVGPLAPF